MKTNKNNDKDSVIALSEIAKDKVSLVTLKSELIKSFQKNLNLLVDLEDNTKK